MKAAGKERRATGERKRPPLHGLLACGLAPFARGLAPFALLLLAPSTAAANGKFPAAGQIVVDPSDPKHVIARTTFGILVSRDSGASFDWICEAGAGYGGGFDPGIAVTGDGSILAGLLDGVHVGHGDACAWITVPGGLAGKPASDVSVLKSKPSTAFALSLGATANSVWISLDQGTQWAQAGVDLPTGFLGQTLDAAPSDPQRIYVGGVHKEDAGFRGAVARSKDGGASWEILDLPPSYGSAAPFLAAIDPADPDRLYARLDYSPGLLLASSDGAASWTTALQISGYLKAFALSPDGATILAGGPSDGLFRAPAATLAFAKVSPVAASCLAWAGDRVYACGTEFAVAVSTDQGSMFSTLLTLNCVRGPLACAPATSVGAVCPDAWGPIAMKLGTATCPKNGGSSSSASASSGAGGGASSSSASGAGGGAPSSPPPGGGCGCRAARDPLGASAWPLALLLLALRRRVR